MFANHAKRAIVYLRKYLCLYKYRQKGGSGDPEYPDQTANRQVFRWTSRIFRQNLIPTEPATVSVPFPQLLFSADCFR